MATKFAKPEFLTFAELAYRWQFSNEYLHDLIRTGQIVPAVALTDQERYVGGRFSGGYGVGDIDNARHESFAEYYIGTVPDDDDFHENRPECSRVVFCHSPTDESDGGYSFQFVSESAAPGHAKEWFYLDHDLRINNIAGERRFRFTWPEIDRLEADRSSGAELGATDASCGTSLTNNDSAPNKPATGQAVVRHTIKSRQHVLTAEIDAARGRALSPDDPASVWSELVKMAEKREGCLLGSAEGQVKYEKEGEVEFLTKKQLTDRLRRAKAR